MKKHNINIDSNSSSSSSHGHAHSTSSFSFSATFTSSSDEWLIDSGASYHMAKEKAIFSTLNESNTNKIFVGDDRSLSVVGSITVQVDTSHFNDVLCVPSLSCKILTIYQINHSGEGKTVYITEIPPPRNLRQLQSLQGKANFLRRFVPDYATCVHGFLRLLRHDIPFRWDEHAQTTFDDLKSGPIQCPFD
jgi:hypothetical protein